jgi:hypothetical protein
VTTAVRPSSSAAALRQRHRREPLGDRRRLAGAGVRDHGEVDRHSFVKRSRAAWSVGSSIIVVLRLLPPSAGAERRRELASRIAEATGAHASGHSNPWVYSSRSGVRAP